METSPVPAFSLLRSHQLAAGCATPTATLHGILVCLSVCLSVYLSVSLARARAHALARACILSRAPSCSLGCWRCKQTRATSAHTRLRPSQRLSEFQRKLLPCPCPQSRGWRRPRGFHDREAMSSLPAASVQVLVGVVGVGVGGSFPSPPPSLTRSVVAAN